MYAGLYECKLPGTQGGTLDMTLASQPIVPGLCCEAAKLDCKQLLACSAVAAQGCRENQIEIGGRYHI